MTITGKVNVDFLEETIEYTYLRGSEVYEFLNSPPKLKRTLAIDIETYAKDKFKKVEDSALYPHRAKIRTLQFFDGETLVILDFMDPDTYEYMLLDEVLADNLQQFLITHTLVAHNALFETCHLQNLFKAHGLKMMPLNIRCTALMYKLVVNAKTPHSKSFFTSLKDLSEQVLGYTPDKEEQTSNWGVKELLTSSQLEYCSFDVILPYYIVRELVQYVEDYNMNEIFLLITEAQEPIAQMKNHGFPVDVAEHKRQWDEWKAKKDKFELECLASLNEEVDRMGYKDLLNMLLAKVTKAFQETMTYLIEEFKDTDKTKFLYNLKKELLFREETEQDHKGMRRALRRVLKNIDGLLLNPDSGKQVSNWLKENLSDDELEGWPLTDSGKDLKTDSEAFEDNDHIEVLSSIVGYKTNSKFSGMYGQKWSEFFMNMGDYTALPVNLNLLGADTGRLSSSKPNIQQAPAAMKLPDFRKILRSKNDDYVLICADYGQIEIRVAAELSGEEVIRQAYRDGIDLHALTASQIGRIPLDKVTKEQRQAAKACFSGDTEVLTKEGWVRFDRYDGKAEVAEYIIPAGVELNPKRRQASRFNEAAMNLPFNGVGGEIVFTKPLGFKKFKNSSFLHATDRNVDILATPNHEILSVSSNGYLKKGPFEDVRDIRNFVAAGYLRPSGQELEDAWTRLVAVTIADGSFKGVSRDIVRFGFTKNRKIQRLRKLLRAVGLPDDYTIGEKGVRYFNVKGLRAGMLQYMTEDKVLHWHSLFRLNRIVFLEEACFWDSHEISGKTRDRVLFGSIVEQTVDVMQAMCAISGIPSVKYREESEHYTEGKFYRLSYSLRTLPLHRASFNKEHILAKSTSYCVQVPAGNILIRRNGKVCVQGNCNFGLLFLGGPDSLKTQAKKSYKVIMTDKEAEDAVEGFQLAYPRLREWQLEVSTRARHNVYVKTKLGKHRRLFPDDTFNTSVNTEVQGSAAECMERASVLVQLGIWDNDYDAVPLALVHDEMIVQAHKSIAEEVRELVEEKMTEGFLYVFPGAPTKGLVEAKIGITWKEAK